LERLCETADARADHAEAHKLRAWARLQMGDVKRALGKTADAVADYKTAAKAAGDLEILGKPTADRAGKADAHDRLADASLALGQAAKALGEAKEALTLRTARADTPPALRAGSLDRVAEAWLELGDTERARLAADPALALRREVHAAAPADPAALAGLADGLDHDAEIKLRLGDTAGAARSAADAVKYARDAAEKEPDRVGRQRAWAAALGRVAEVAAERGDLAALAAARAEAAKVLADVTARDALNTAARSEAAIARGRLGVARLRQGNPSAAAADTRAARGLADDLAELDPESPWSGRAVGFTAWDRGDVLLAAGDKAGAVAEFATAVARFEGLAKAQPDSARAARDAAEARERLAAARAAAAVTPQDRAAAIKLLEASVAERATAAEKDGGNARAARDVAAAYGRLSEAHLDAGNLVAAEAAAEAAAVGFRRRADTDAANLAAVRDLSAARSAWGRVTGIRGEATATLILLGQAQDGFDRVAAADPTNPVAVEERAAALTRLADALGDADHPAFRLRAELDALELRRKEAEERPDDPVAQRGLVTSKRRLAELDTAYRRYAPAAALYREADAVLAKFPGHPVLAAEAAAVAAGKEVLAGVKAAAASRTSVTAIESPDVRARVLRVIAEDALRQNQPVTATWAAGLLADNARGGDDIYRAAVVFARAAARPMAPPADADLAVELLERAAARGFRNPDLLRARWWDGLRDRDRFRAAAGKIGTR
jgi:hypothetical protein